MVGRLALFLAFALVQHSAVGARSQRPGTLFIGNSMTFFNHGPDVYGALDQHRRVVDDIVGPGFTLTRHLDEARWPWTRVAALPYVVRGRYRTLIMQDAGARAHDAAFNTAAWRAMTSGALPFARQAHAWGARVVLYVQPFRDDVRDCALYRIRQSNVNAGYQRLAETLRREGIDVRVAPVGEAFARISMQSLDGCASGEEFDMLFRADNHHPSLRGTYLAMALLYATANDMDVREVRDEPRLGHAVSARLRSFAHLAMQDEARRTAQ